MCRTRDIHTGRFKKRKPTFEERVQRHCGDYKIICSGLCGECSQCRSSLNMKVEWDDVVIKDDGMYLLDECIMTLDDLKTEYESRESVEPPLDKEDIIECFRQELDYLDIPDELLTKLFNEKISDQRYLDEGGFSRQGCDTCGNPLGNTLYEGHGVNEDGSIDHLQMCTDCVMWFANGDAPIEEDD